MHMAFRRLSRLYIGELVRRILLCSFLKPSEHSSMARSKVITDKKRSQYKRRKEITSLQQTPESKNKFHPAMRRSTTGTFKIRNYSRKRLKCYGQMPV
ncbi:hypothetical protein CPB86DRAFT_551766 [Serendipita vermifera]|nr:hypothetical protein CPB86DRAFT_551766 [Serendipita vermifera]